eukprot:jgi/Psemu1/323516/estExt_fgenesh1_pg.C_750028
MMRNIQTSQQQQQQQQQLPLIVADPSKRWTRSKEHIAASSTAAVDFYRYRTSGMKKTKSDRSAALLLSYAYYQQNQKDNHSMDRGATWLTHLPAKHSKRGSSTFYFHDADGLPPLYSADDAGNNGVGVGVNGIVDDDDDGTDSCATLSMRQPGPQKFLRLMAYVQQQLIAKEKEQQQQQLLLLDGTTQSVGTHSGGKSRTRAMAESIEAPKGSDATKQQNRIRMMAESIEGTNTTSTGTPTMTLRTGTPFSCSTGASSQNRSRRGKSRHDALRAYRKNRASLSPEETDLISEASSFHALPDQIRMVVQNSGGGKSPHQSSASAQQQIQQQQQQQQFSTPDDYKYASPVRSQSTLSQSELSDEQYKRAHGRFIQNSALLGGEFQHETIIDTDGTQSDASGTADMDPQTLASLMMSPDILQKRLKQAIGSVEQRKWEQVLFLINANPWLAEMKELTTNQFLLHKLAFFGKGPPAAPISLGEQLVEKFPSAVYKFDQDGNVPLHLAAASGNVEMIQMLGEKFESGASIRNEDGMLPLHFAIASFAEYDGQQYGEGSEEANSRPLDALKTVLKLFPKAVAIADNDGNIPLHVASECLQGGIGVDVIFLLLDEGERQLQDPYGARFRNKIKMEDFLDDDMSAGTMSTARDTDSSVQDTELRCNMVLNDFNETPLFTAIRSQRGWEMIEALVSGPGGRKAALSQDADKNNALHLLVGEFQDATAAMSILKIVSETALQRNAAGILPIEIACMQLMPEEVILAIALVDLPVAIDDRDGLKVLKDRGESWTFLTCDSDDHMVRVVEEIVSICSFQQLQELCFATEHGSENAIIDRATPKCRDVMNRALRFLGRFEFVGDGPLFADIQTGFKAFEALDFGNNESGKRVLLECYTNEFDFENRCYTMFEVELDNTFVEEVNVYVEHSEEEGAVGGKTPEEVQQQQQRCVAIERPRMTLDKVVNGMTQNGSYENDTQDVRLKYSAKLCSVLRLIAKAIRHLHSSGVVHGNVCLETCGKFEDSMWKLTERLDVQAIGKPFDPTRFRHSFPPETLVLTEDHERERDGGVFDSDHPAVGFAEDIVADPSIDVWAFGKICYEGLVGKPLIEFDSDANDSPSDDVIALLQTAEWNVSNMERVFADLLESGIGESGADMITSCLFPHPEERPADMDEILENPFWQEIRKHRSPRKGRVRRKGGGSIESSTASLLTDVEKYEV